MFREFVLQMPSYHSHPEFRMTLFVMMQIAALCALIGRSFSPCQLIPQAFVDALSMFSVTSAVPRKSCARWFRLTIRYWHI